MAEETAAVEEPPAPADEPRAATEEPGQQQGRQARPCRIISTITYIDQKMTYTWLNKCNLARQQPIQDFTLGC